MTAKCNFTNWLSRQEYSFALGFNGLAKAFRVLQAMFVFSSTLLFEKLPKLLGPGT